MNEYIDFVGFTFNGRHSSEFNIYSVSDGSRYQHTLVPSPIDYTEQVPGGAGQYYFGSDLDIKEFPLEIAFDNVTEKQLREMKQWLAPSKVGELIFDETPYKSYTAKISESPEISFICFDEGEGNNKRRVYKGEGNINFICYFPFAKTPEGRKTLNSKDYSEYGNKDEWAEASRLAEDLSGFDIYDENLSDGGARGFTVYNPGDIPANFILTFNKPADMHDDDGITISLNTTDNYSMTLKFLTETSETYGSVSDAEQKVATKFGLIEINTKRKQILFYENGDLAAAPKSIYFALKEGNFFRIPNDRDKENAYQLRLSTAHTDIGTPTIKYDYLYY